MPWLATLRTGNMPLWFLLVFSLHDWVISGHYVWSLNVFEASQGDFEFPECLLSLSLSSELSVPFSTIAIRRLFVTVSLAFLKAVAAFLARVT